MRRQLVDIKDDQPVLGEDPFDNEQRQIREMLVVDRIELAFLH